MAHSPASRSSARRCSGCWPKSAQARLLSRQRADGGVYFVDGDKTTPADQIFEDALVFWTQFIYANRVAKSDWDDGVDAPLSEEAPPS
jgi:hypothetical protein